MQGKASQFGGGGIWILDLDALMIDACPALRVQLRPGGTGTSE